MKKTILCLMTATVLFGCKGPECPRADYVIILGFDAMSALGVQRAETPAFNHMIENGAISLHTRCVRETSSSQNWMSMVSASPIEIHGVLGNKWEAASNGKPGATDCLAPAMKNGLGLYPTIFDHIREQKPELRQFAYIEWTGETRMFDMSAFTESHVMKRDTSIHEYGDVIRHAFADYLEKRPEMLFLSMDITDHIGHSFGHESKEYFDTIHEMDALVGDFVGELEARGWMKNTVIIVTADHGGISAGHGGDTMAEFEIPIILYGKGVTKGKVLKRTSMIYDVGATAAALLGVELPWECRGKMLDEAFGPADSDIYVPVPLVTPFAGKAQGEITITADAPDTEIRYTMDGSEPDETSPLYSGPFTLDSPTVVKSASYRHGCRSITAENYLYPGGTEAPIAYKLYKNVTDPEFPDFTKFGKPDGTGYVNAFALDEFGLNEEDYFAILFTSHLVVEQAGTYHFGMKNDDGAILYIDGKVLIDNSGAHSTKSPKIASVELGEGRHTIKVEYQEVNKTQGLELTWSFGDEKLKPILPDCLDR